MKRALIAAAAIVVPVALFLWLDPRAEFLCAFGRWLRDRHCFPHNRDDYAIAWTFGMPVVWAAFVLTTRVWWRALTIAGIRVAWRLAEGWRSLVAEAKRR
jgi:hypothetical protein